MKPPARAEQKDAPPFWKPIRTKRRFAVPPYFACTLRMQTSWTDTARRCNGRTQRSLLANRFPKRSGFRCASPGRPSPNCPSPFHQPGALCAVQQRLLSSRHRIWRNFITIRAPCQAPGRQFFGRLERITMFLHYGQLYASWGRTRFSKRD